MLEIKEIFADEEFAELQEKAAKIYSKRKETREEKESEYKQVKTLVSAILDSFSRADMHGKVPTTLTICKLKNGNIIVEMETECKTQKNPPKYSDFTKNLEKTVKQLMSEYWDSSVWFAICEVFNNFLNYSANYSTMPDTNTLIVKFD